MHGSIPESDLEATRRFYDRISGVYDAIADASEHEARERGQQLLAVRPGERILEVGHGTGASLVDLAQAVGPEGDVWGIDISERMRDQALQRATRAGLEGRVHLKVAAAPPLPYDTAFFDAAFLSFTLELFPDDVIPELLGEIRRVVREGGRLGVVAMTEHPPDEKDSLIERAYGWMHRHFPHIVDCRPIPVRDVLRKAGWTVTTHDALSIWSLSVLAVVADR